MSLTNNNICILLDSRSSGGIETHVQQLAEGLVRHGENVQVVFLTDYGEHPLRNALHRQGIATRSLDGRITSLFKALRKSRPSILHTHGYKAGIFGRLAAWLNGIRTVTTYHAGELSSGKLALYDWLDRQSGHLAAKVFAVSPQIVSRLPVAAELADNFIEVSELKDSHGEQLAFVGRLSHEKGPDRLLELATRFPQNRFHLYGDGPIAPALISSAAENVLFHGLQDDMPSVWPEIGLLIMPSRHEGLPMAALEAMGRGIPLLGSNVGALDQLIDTNRNGWLVASGDIEEMVCRLRQWLNMNMQERDRFRQSARQKVEQRFSAKIAIPRLIACYRQVATAKETS